MGKAVWQAFLDHKMADQNSGGGSSNSFSLSTEGEVKKKMLVKTEEGKNSKRSRWWRRWVGEKRHSAQ